LTSSTERCYLYIIEGCKALQILKGCGSNESLKMMAFLLVGTFFVVQGIPAYAEVLPNSSQSVESNISISPMWTSINDITLDLYFEGGEACCAGKI
jgi:hypothetical protein